MVTFVGNRGYRVIGLFWLGFNLAAALSPASRPPPQDTSGFSHEAGAAVDGTGFAGVRG